MFDICLFVLSAAGLGLYQTTCECVRMCVCGGSKREMMLQERNVGDGEGGNDRFVRDGVCLMSERVGGRHPACVDVETITRGSPGPFLCLFHPLPFTILFTLNTAKDIQDEVFKSLWLQSDILVINLGCSTVAFTSMFATFMATRRDYVVDYRNN